MDLQQQLQINLEQIIGQYASYVYCILTSVKAKEVSVTDLRSFLLNLPAFQSGCNEQCNLLSGVKKELDEADTINKIFDLLSCECASFLNIAIFQFIVDEYGIEDSRGRDRLKYPEHLDEYIKKHKVSEFVAVNPALKRHARSEGSVELVLKFNVELTCKLAKVIDLQSAVAKILRVQPSALQLLSIEKGCLIVKFLISAEVADIVFVWDKKLTPEEYEEFRTLEVMWLECNGCKYDFTAEVNAGEICGSIHIYMVVCYFVIIRTCLLGSEIQLEKLRQIQLPCMSHNIEL